MKNTTRVLIALVLGAAATAEPLNFDRRTPVVQVVEKMSPHVVMIKTDVRRKVRVDPFEGLGFRSFFGGPGFVGERIFTSAGSGVILDRNGTVVTNAHVVADANRLTAITSDSVEHPLTLIGIDRDFDIAILQLEPTERDQLQPTDIDWGSSADLMIGETAVVIGSALSFQNSVTVGVISAVERTIQVPDREPYFGMIQTDAAINRGNSGGPLVNIRGELIGVTTLIATEGGGSDGIGFAIPVERVQTVYREFVQGIVSLEERLGITVVNPHVVEGIHPSQTDRLGLRDKQIRGLILVKLSPEGLASQNGLREADLLIEVDGRSVVDRRDLQRALEEHEFGRPLPVAALRVNPKTGEVERVSPEIPTDPSFEIERADSWFGFEVEGIRNEVADAMGVSIDDGVVIRSVQRGSPAQAAGLAAGDLIQGIDNYRIQTVGDFRRLQHFLQKQEKVRFRFLRDRQMYVVDLSQPAGGQRL
jgi:S1-C subfamily serine protease